MLNASLPCALPCYSSSRPFLARALQPHMRMQQQQQLQPPQQRGSATAKPSAQSPPIVIAVDGPAAAGKGTLSKMLAAACGLAHLDTGALYRALGLAALRAGVALDDEDSLEALANKLSPDDLVSPELRTEAVGSAASKVSSLLRVRAALGAYPRTFAANPPAGLLGSVLDGRDVGTVLCPDANCKLFIMASDEVRAQRRLTELRARGGPQAEGVTFQAVLQDMQARDLRDRTRAAAPLKAAEDAVVLDTSSMSAAEVLEAALMQVRARCPGLSIRGS